MIQNLRSLHIQGSESPAVTPLERNATANQRIWRMWKPKTGRSLTSAEFTGGFKRLPQETVDEILEYLVDDRRTLIACSLTSRGLLRSARRIIHRRLRLVGPEYKFQCEAANRAKLLMLSAAAELGLAQYTRELTIKIGGEFTPKNLLPYLPQFQTFARLTSLTLHDFDPSPFLHSFERYFGHLAQQMRSLEFISTPGPQYNMMYFISQFPNLEDLGFDPFPAHNLNPYGKYNISAIRSSPTLGGTLQVTSTNAWWTRSLQPLARLPSGLRFRSIEFLHCTRIDPNIIIQECTSTLQSLTHVVHTREFSP